MFLLDAASQVEQIGLIIFIAVKLENKHICLLLLSNSVSLRFWPLWSLCISPLIFWCKLNGSVLGDECKNCRVMLRMHCFMALSGSPTP